MWLPKPSWNPSPSVLFYPFSFLQKKIFTGILQKLHIKNGSWIFNLIFLGFCMYNLFRSDHGFDNIQTNLQYFHSHWSFFSWYWNDMQEPELTHVYTFPLFSFLKVGFFVSRLLDLGCHAQTLMFGLWCNKCYLTTQSKNKK